MGWVYKIGDVVNNLKVIKIETANQGNKKRLYVEYIYVCGSIKNVV